MKHLFQAQWLLTAIFYLWAGYGFAQKKIDIQRIEPTFWWVGMKNPELQLLVYGKNIAQSKVTLNYPGVTLREVTQVTNPNYLFVKLHIDPTAKAGKVPITFQQATLTTTVQYELFQKASDAENNAKKRIQGFNQTDVMYLVMPDRFVNADPNNDNVQGMKETAARDSAYGRHGGDLKGITDNLQYVKDLGMTALWLNPVLENDMKQFSYHGYAITDFYKVDKRFGGNDAYLQFIEKAHSLGMKVIQDMVANHIGDQHWLHLDPPQNDWVYQYPQYVQSNYRLSTTSDPYASQYDKDRMNKGWFDRSMPDVNQTNPLVATYLIQNSIWWVEYAGIDGIRMDTYPYPEQNFMAKWSEAILNEYPKFNIVGEVWIGSVPLASYWAKGTPNRDGYRSTLPSITDFPVYNAIHEALKGNHGWESGMMKLYNTVGEDFLYEKPDENVIFLDNHDVTRFATEINSDVNKYKLGVAFLMTTRGIPQVYYGTELLMTGGPDHGSVRRDFPVRAFKPEGRNSTETETVNYMQKLANWRKNKKVIHSGKLMHFVPENAFDHYVYFRYDDKETVMVVLNFGKEARKLSKNRYQERLNGFTTATDVVTGKTFQLDNIEVAPMSALVLELK